MDSDSPSYKICVLDEPSNFLDREALGGLAVAIRDWAGAVVCPSSSLRDSHPTFLQVIISHNEEFASALCEHLAGNGISTSHSFLGPEVWHMENGRMTHKGKAAIVEDAFLDKKGSGLNTPVRSRLQTPVASRSGTPAGSGAEDGTKSATPVVKKKKKPTRNQMKAQEERRRLRKLEWLTKGGPRPEDTESEGEP